HPPPARWSLRSVHAVVVTRWVSRGVMASGGKGMSQDALPQFVEATATKFGIPGAAIGVRADGKEIYACHNVNSVENPLPVDLDTLFVLGSVTKPIRRRR